MKKVVLIFGLLMIGSGFLVNAKFGDWFRENIVEPVQEKVQDVIEKVEEKVIDPVVGGIGSIQAKQREACKMLHDGASQLAKTPQDFRDGLVELEQLPGQLEQGAEKISQAIANIHASRQDAKKQQDEIKAQDLGAKGMGDLETSLLAALDELESAMVKLANTDDSGNCVGGILCKFLEVSNQKKGFAQANLAILNNQIRFLEEKIIGNKSLIGGKKLPERMRSAGKAINLGRDCK